MSVPEPPRYVEYRRVPLLPLSLAMKASSYPPGCLWKAPLVVGKSGDKVKPVM